MIVSLTFHRNDRGDKASLGGDCALGVTTDPSWKHIVQGSCWGLTDAGTLLQGPNRQITFAPPHAKVQTEEIAGPASQGFASAQRLFRCGDSLTLVLQPSPGDRTTRDLTFYRNGTLVEGVIFAPIPCSMDQGFFVFLRLAGSGGSVADLRWRNPHFFHVTSPPRLLSGAADVPFSLFNRKAGRTMAHGGSGSGRGTSFIFNSDS